jgi:hypothetical protein
LETFDIYGSSPRDPILRLGAYFTQGCILGLILPELESSPRIRKLEQYVFCIVFDYSEKPLLVALYNASEANSYTKNLF